MINRIRKYLPDMQPTQNSSKPPAVAIEDLQKAFKDLQEEDVPDFETPSSDDFDGDDFDRDDFDSDDDGDDNEDDSYLNDKLEVARDKDSVLSEARVIFQKDPATGKVFMIARLDEMDLPDYFSPDGDEMFRSDVIIRIFGKAYANPRTASDPVDPDLFKKKNWRERI